MAPTRIPTGRTGRIFALITALSLALIGVGAGAPAVATIPPGGPPSGAPLTNVAHLTFLLAPVPLLPVAGHTTYLMDKQPTAQAPWVYANWNGDGTYTRVGGGSLDPATGHYGQGAFDSDDIARAAVVYLRHWQQTGSLTSKEHAFQVLRSLTYLQTSSGPNAGNVVLWQQSDGTLNPSAIPSELPDPSDSAESYWLARTIWALGEGYAAFRGTDPAFASFLQARLRLAIDSLNRQSLARYGSYDLADGVQVPAWLITGGADASAEAVLGLSAYVRADPSDHLVSSALSRLAEGVAAMSSGSLGHWPFGAILPWNKSQTFWHAWGGMAPAAVSLASGVLRRPDLVQAAVLDAAQFTPQLLAAGGPDNLWGPTPAEAQIAYGADCRLEGLVATARNAAGLLDVAAVAAGWFFGANRSGLPTYDPGTGTAIDGIEADGRVNKNSGAESTIHTLLAMLTLDANPRVRAAALAISHTVSIDGLTVVQAESGTVVGGSVVTPASAWTGEALWSGGAYVALAAGGTLRIPVPASSQPRNVYPVVNQSEAPAGFSSWTSGRARLGTTPNGGAAPQGITDAPGKLLPFSLARPLPAGADVVVATSTGAAALDALLIQPLLSSVVVSGSGGELTMYVSASPHSTTRTVDVPRGFVLEQRAFDSSGRPLAVPRDRSSVGPGNQVTVAAGGFTFARIVRR
jgi:hypothetical protein